MSREGDEKNLWQREHRVGAGTRLTRRGALAGAALFGAGVAVDRVLPSGDAETDPQAGSSSSTAEFYGPHQAGIATSAQEFLHFAAFDVTSGSADDLRELLHEWTLAAAELTKGREPGAVPRDPTAVPVDTGEALGLGPCGLTLTFGFGPSLFANGDRFGLASRRPAALRPLPSFAGDSLDPARSEGDICVQACAEHPQVAFHAIHVLARIASGAAVLRWSQGGFGRTSSISRSQPTPRNLMGFKDGTNNIRGEEDEAMDRFVWVQPSDGAGWMAGGTYLIARRIKMLLDVWDATSLEGQERAIGRGKASGAPLGQEDEYAPVDLEARENGEPTIPIDAHVRLASAHNNDGQRILRRGYSYSEPTAPGSGEIDAGLFFISFQRDPQRQFVPMQRRLTASDALTRHLLHTASGIFACPPGVRRGGFVGEGMFA